MFSLVWLRGNVGTDTDSYTRIIDNLQSIDYIIFVFEPGFTLLIFAISQFIHDPLIIIKIIATIITVLLIIVKWNSVISYQTLALGVIPYFYLDMTMNGLRYGLAFAIALIALKQLLASQTLRYLTFSFIAMINHLSSFYLTSVLILIHKPSRITYLGFASCVAVLVIIGSYYFMSRFQAYIYLSSPSIFSGLGPVLLSLIILIGCSLDRQFRRNGLSTIVVLFFITIFFYGIAIISYAGLRFLTLNYFLILMFVIYTAEKTNKKSSKIILISLIIASILGSAFRLRNFYIESGVGESPFSPYLFYWEY
jgi:hypothetical protein